MTGNGNHTTYQNGNVLVPFYASHPFWNQSIHLGDKSFWADCTSAEWTSTQRSACRFQTFWKGVTNPSVPWQKPCSWSISCSFCSKVSSVTPSWARWTGRATSILKDGRWRREAASQCSMKCLLILVTQAFRTCCLCASSACWALAKFLANRSRNDMTDETGKSARVGGSQSPRKLLPGATRQASCKQAMKEAPWNREESDDNHVWYNCSQAAI